MSKPSVWNGRNESILGSSGPSVAVTDADATQNRPTSNVDDAKSSSSNHAADKGAKKANGAAPSSVTPAVKNVWNGRHDKIMEIRDKTEPSSSKTATAEKALPSSVTNGSNSHNSNNNGSKKDCITLNQSTNIRVAMVSPAPKVDGIKSSLQGKQSHHAKEDEGTNSTAGSSTTNMDEDPAEDVPMVSSALSSSEANAVIAEVKKDGGAPELASSSNLGEVNDSSAPGGNGASGRRSHVNSSSNSEGGVVAAAPRRSSSGSNAVGKGGRTNNRGSSGGNNGANNGNSRQNYSRASSAGSGRRRGKHQ